MDEIKIKPIKSINDYNCKLIYLQAVLMKNGEIISNKKSLGFFTEEESKYIYEPIEK